MDYLVSRCQKLDLNSNKLGPLIILFLTRCIVTRCLEPQKLCPNLSFEIRWQSTRWKFSDIPIASKKLYLHKSRICKTMEAFLKQIQISVIFIKIWGKLALHSFCDRNVLMYFISHKFFDPEIWLSSWNRYLGSCTHTEEIPRRYFFHTSTLPVWFRSER
jgi:hypothetical protein